MSILQRQAFRLMNPLLLTGGRVLDPTNHFYAPTDLLIVDGKIAAHGDEARQGRIVQVTCLSHRAFRRSTSSTVDVIGFGLNTLEATPKLRGMVCNRLPRSCRVL